MKPVNLFFIIFISLLYTSCRQSFNKLPIDFDYANEYLQEKNDSIAFLLEEFNPADLEGKDKADYWYLITKLHQSQNRSLAYDSLINFSVEYYEQTNSPHLSEAYMLAALQVYWPGELSQKTKRLFDKSLEIAEQTSDTINFISASANAAYIYFFEKQYPEAITSFKRSLLFKNQWNMITSNYLIGCSYLFMNEKDSCFHYLDKAIEAVGGQNNRNVKDLIRNYADAYNYFDDSKRAIQILNTIRINEESDPKLLVSYANAWLNLNQLDSAKVYLQKMSDVIENQHIENAQLYFYESMFTIFNSIYKSKIGLPGEMVTFAQYADRFRRSIEYTQAKEKENTFHQNRLLRDKNKLQIEKAKQLQFYLIIIVILIAITGIMVFIYQRKLLQKERLIQSAKEHLRQYLLQVQENENIINNNQNVINMLTSQLEENSGLQEQMDEIELIRKNNSALQNDNLILKEKIERYSKIVLSKDAHNKNIEEINTRNIQLQEREKFLTEQLISNNEILKRLKNQPKYITEEEWHIIINTINVFFNFITTRLHTEYPKLTDEDIRYCSLIKLRLPTSAIGVLMGVSPTSVTKRKHRIKEKMSMQNSQLFAQESLDSFLWNY